MSQQQQAVGDAALMVATTTAVQEASPLQVDFEGDTLNIDPALLNYPKIVAKAEQAVDQLLNKAENLSNEQRRNAIDNLGQRTSDKARQASAMLKNPLKDLNIGGKESGGTQVADTLVELTTQVEELDPVQLDKVGWPSRLIGRIPGVGTPMMKYFMRYESAQTIIERIMNSLEYGKNRLLSDNKILSADQERMRQVTLDLQQVIALARQMDIKLSSRIDGITNPDEKLFIEQQLLFPLRQRTQDLYQQLLVNQQGFIAIEIIIGNNRELIRGVKRAQDVTIVALQVAVQVALALNHQKIVLDKITRLNTTTSNLIAATSARLRTQGTTIQKQAASAQLDMSKLKSSFQDLSAAITDLRSFRTKALPVMETAIQDMGLLANEAEKEIEKIERGHLVRSKNDIIFDIESEEAV